MERRVLGAIILVFVVIIAVLFFAQTQGFFSPQQVSINQTIIYSDLTITKTISFAGTGVEERTETYLLDLKNPVVAFLITPKSIATAASEIKTSGEDFASEVVQDDPILLFTSKELSPGKKTLTLTLPNGDENKSTLLFLVPLAGYNTFSQEDKDTIKEAVIDAATRGEENFEINESKKIMQDYADTLNSATLEGANQFSSGNTKAFFADSSGTTVGNVVAGLRLVDRVLAGLNTMPIRSDAAGATEGYEITLKFNEEQSLEIPTSIELFLSDENPVAAKTFRFESQETPEINLSAELTNAGVSYFASEISEGVFELTLSAQPPLETLAEIQEFGQIEGTLNIERELFSAAAIPIKITKSYCGKALSEENTTADANIFEYGVCMANYSNELISGMEKQRQENFETALEKLNEKAPYKPAQEIYKLLQLGEKASLSEISTMKIFYPGDGNAKAYAINSWAIKKEKEKLAQITAKIYEISGVLSKTPTKENTALVALLFEAILSSTEEEMELENDKINLFGYAFSDIEKNTIIHAKSSTDTPSASAPQNTVSEAGAVIITEETKKQMAQDLDAAKTRLDLLWKKLFEQHSKIVANYGEDETLGFYKTHFNDRLAMKRAEKIFGEDESLANELVLTQKIEELMAHNSTNPYLSEEEKKTLIENTKSVKKAMLEQALLSEYLRAYENDIFYMRLFNASLDKEALSVLGYELEGQNSVWIWAKLLSNPYLLFKGYYKGVGNFISGSSADQAFIDEDLLKYSTETQGIAIGLETYNTLVHTEIEGITKTKDMALFFTKLREKLQKDPKLNQLIWAKNANLLVDSRLVILENEFDGLKQNTITNEKLLAVIKKDQQLRLVQCGAYVSNNLKPVARVKYIQLIQYIDNLPKIYKNQTVYDSALRELKAFQPERTFLQTFFFLGGTSLDGPTEALLQNEMERIASEAGVDKGSETARLWDERLTGFSDLRYWVGIGAALKVGGKLVPQGVKYFLKNRSWEFTLLKKLSWLGKTTPFQLLGEMPLIRQVIHLQAVQKLFSLPVLTTKAAPFLKDLTINSFRKALNKGGALTFDQIVQRNSIVKMSTVFSEEVAKGYARKATFEGQTISAEINGGQVTVGLTKGRSGDTIVTIASEPKEVLSIAGADGQEVIIGMSEKGPIKELAFTEVKDGAGKVVAKKVLIPGKTTAYRINYPITLEEVVARVNAVRTKIATGFVDASDKPAIVFAVNKKIAQSAAMASAGVASFADLTSVPTYTITYKGKTVSLNPAQKEVFFGDPNNTGMLYAVVEFDEPRIIIRQNGQMTLVKNPTGSQIQMPNGETATLAVKKESIYDYLEPLTPKDMPNRENYIAYLRTQVVCTENNFQLLQGAVFPESPPNSATGGFTFSADGQWIGVFPADTLTYAEAASLPVHEETHAVITDEVIAKLNLNSISKLSLDELRLTLLETFPEYSELSYNTQIQELFAFYNSARYERIFEIQSREAVELKKQLLEVIPGIIRSMRNDPQQAAFAREFAARLDYSLFRIANPQAANTVLSLFEQRSGTEAAEALLATCPKVEVPPKIAETIELEKGSLTFEEQIACNANGCKVRATLPPNGTILPAEEAGTLIKRTTGGLVVDMARIGEARIRTTTDFWMGSTQKMTFSCSFPCKLNGKPFETADSIGQAEQLFASRLEKLTTIEYVVPVAGDEAALERLIGDSGLTPMVIFETFKRAEGGYALSSEQAFAKYEEAAAAFRAGKVIVTTKPLGSKNILVYIPKAGTAVTEPGSYNSYSEILSAIQTEADVPPLGVYAWGMGYSGQRDGIGNSYDLFRRNADKSLAEYAHSFLGIGDNLAGGKNNITQVVAEFKNQKSGKSEWVYYFKNKRDYSGRPSRAVVYVLLDDKQSEALKALIKSQPEGVHEFFYRLTGEFPERFNPTVREITFDIDLATSYSSPQAGLTYFSNATWRRRNTQFGAVIEANLGSNPETISYRPVSSEFSPAQGQDLSVISNVNNQIGKTNLEN